MTLRNCRTHIRRAASELVRGGRDPMSITSLRDLVEPEAVKLILRRLWAPERKQPKGQTYNIGRTLLAIARHRVKAPEADIALIAKLCRNAKPPRAGMTDKNARAPHRSPRRGDGADACRTARQAAGAGPAAPALC